MNNQRVQKILAQLGQGSRRQIETLIKAGRIEVNNKIAELGQRISETDRVKIDGRPIKLRKSDSTRVLIYHKPDGEICTRHDPEGRPTVFENLPDIKHGRWLNVGRLDFNSSGLLLFTNDGELANKLMHPSQQLEREYAVRVLGEVTPEIINQLLIGVRLDDGMASFKKMQYAGGEGANTWYHVVLTEGRNREVRRLWESQGCTVSRLMRIRFGKIQLPSNLRRGHFQELDKKLVSSII